jgi:hypothetical protein
MSDRDPPDDPNAIDATEALWPAPEGAPARAAHGSDARLAAFTRQNAARLLVACSRARDLDLGDELARALGTTRAEVAARARRALADRHPEGAG